MVLTGIEARCGGLFFTSKFDSGNLANVEKVFKDEEDSGGGGDPRADCEFNVWTRPDASGSPFENGNRSWFYFGVRGGSPGRVIKINIMNMNRQGKLYSQGHCPIVKTVPGRPKWERLRDRPTWESVENNFVLSFTHRFLEAKGATTYFAFCYPWSYEEQQNQLSLLDTKFKHCPEMTPTSSPDSIYYHREVLCHSLDNYNVDLVTVSSCHGIQKGEEPRFDEKLFPCQETPRCKAFKNKRVYLVSSRVHPGETPASFVFNGFLDFILDPDDARAKQLRRQFVFKLIPILNPDGVVRGHYRTDSRGVNLNRMYLDPSFELFPSIYASKSLLVFHHVHNSIQLGSKDRTKVKMADAFQRDSTSGRQQRPPAATSSSKEPSQSEPRNRTYKKQGSHSLNAVNDLSKGVASMMIEKQTTLHSACSIQSGGEFGDFEDDTEHLGNEGSEDEGCREPVMTEGVHAPHLSDRRLLDIKPHESGIALYVDLHGHASKRGCFIYGNYFDTDDQQAENMLFPKLISLNTAHFDFTGCNFTERNMYTKDKREGLSKEGAGRVAIYKALGIIHSYTLECNYNTGRLMNSIPQATGDGGRATPPPLAGFPPKYTQAHFEEVGKAMAIAGLDLTESNPWSRITHSEFLSLHGLREWLKRYVRSLRGMGKGASNASRAMRAAAKASGSSGGPGSFVPRVALLGRSVSNEPSTSYPGSTFTTAQSVSNNKSIPFGRRVLSNSSATKKELGPVREPPRGGAMDRTKRRYSQPVTSYASRKSSATLSASMPKTSLPQSASAPVTLCFTSASGNDPKNSPLEEVNEGSSFRSSPAKGDRKLSGPGVNSKSRAINQASVAFGASSEQMLQEMVQQLRSGASSTQSMEEEKFAQLKNISHKAVPPKPSYRAAKPLEPPRSDPVKRRSKRPVFVSKRRSSSHSPQSAKLSGNRAEPEAPPVAEAKTIHKIPRRGSSFRSKGSRSRQLEEQVEGEEMTDGGDATTATETGEVPSVQIVEGQDLCDEADETEAAFSPKLLSMLQAKQAHQFAPQMVQGGGRQTKLLKAYNKRRLLSTLEVGEGLRQSCLNAGASLVPASSAYATHFARKRRKRLNDPGNKRHSKV